MEKKHIWKMVVSAALLTVLCVGCNSNSKQDKETEPAEDVYSNIVCC